MRYLIAVFFLASSLLGNDDSYVFLNADGHTTISRGSLHDVQRVRERFPQPPLLWARIDGREYLIRDAATLDEVRKASGPLDAHGRKQDALHEKMRPVERRAERLEREADALSDAGDLTREQKARLRQLEQSLRETERELRLFEQEEQRLDRTEEELEKIFDAEVARIVRRAVRDGRASRVR